MFRFNKKLNIWVKEDENTTLSATQQGKMTPLSEIINPPDSNIKIFGHQHPDLDSISCSLALAYLLNSQGMSVTACRLGKYNAETLYAMNHFGIDQDLQYIEGLSDGDKVILVDHNEASQSAVNIENAEVVMLIDHHGINNFSNANPIDFTTRPWGCASTIIYKMLHESGVKPRRDIWGMLLSAIISDTLLLRSPTTTEKDKTAAKELATALGEDLEKYGIALLAAGADTRQMSARDILLSDSKLYKMGKLRIRISATSFVKHDSVLDRRSEMEEEMFEMISLENLDLFIVMITDIINCNSDLLVLGNRRDVVCRAFGIMLQNNTAFVQGLVSRKKQVVPVLTKILKP